MTDITTLLGADSRRLAEARLQGHSQGAACTCPARISSTASSPSPTAHRQVLRNLAELFDHGRLGGTGYLSILPVDQGIEHSAGASLRAEPDSTSTPRTS